MSYSKSTYEKATHIKYIDKDNEKGLARYFTYGKIYKRHYDRLDDEYYIISDNGIEMYAFDVVLKVEYLKKEFV